MTISPPERIMSVMCFDFGTKRIGIATGQRLTATTQALNPIKARDGIPDWNELHSIIQEWQPDAFVTGLPLNMDGTLSDMSLRARKFSQRLEGRFHRPSYTHDERLTSFEAKGIVMSHTKERDFGHYSVDGIAAQLILESWMETHPRSNASL